MFLRDCCRAYFLESCFEVFPATKSGTYLRFLSDVHNYYNYTFRTGEY